MTSSSDNFSIEKNGGFLDLITHFDPDSIQSIEEALNLSIEKWKFLRDYLSDPEHIKLPYDGAGDTCGLCLYCAVCEECPVARSGDQCSNGDYINDNCCGTPYTAYKRAQTREDALAAAIAEVAFLESCRAEAIKMYYEGGC